MTRIISLQVLMDQFDLGRLMEAVTSLVSFSPNADANPFASIQYPASLYGEQKESADYLCERLERMEFKAALASAKDIKDVLASHVTPASGGYDQVVMDAYGVRRFRSLAGQIASRISDEASGTKAILLTLSEAKLYEQTEPIFGEVVLKVFPGAEFDLVEAGRCMAMGRYTASVFHLMRAVESAVHSLATKLNATIKNSHDEALPLGVTLANIKAKIDEMPGGHEKDRWKQDHALLDSVNRAWRTKTAHPVAVYTEEEARAVLGSVQSFMASVAEQVS